jgi:hypothetical protein
MNTLECTKAIQQPVNKLGSGFMLDGATFARAPEIGLEPGLGFYVLGRFGALGRVHADVVTAAGAFLAPRAVASYWDAAVALAEPAAAAALFMDCADSWGRARLADVPGLDRLNALAGDVVAEAWVGAAPLFAALRALPRSSDPAGLATQLAFMLRELRMARHVVAVQAVGLSPLEAILSGDGGEGNAAMFGWEGPFGDISSLRDRRAEAEALTNEIHARDLAVLDDAGRVALAEGLTAAFAALG